MLSREEYILQWTFGQSLHSGSGGKYYKIQGGPGYILQKWSVAKSGRNKS